MNRVYDTEMLAGRILMSILFLFSGTMKIRLWPMFTGLLVGKHLPAPQAALAGALLIELVGGLCVLVGFKIRLASLVMFLYLIPVTVLFHNFWAFSEAMRQGMLVHFLKNIAIMAGLLAFAAHGAGGYSLDARRSN
jgi:putative oxidoreductase